MQKKWYSDNRDVLKWSALLTIAEKNKTSRILQILFYRESVYPKIALNGKNYPIPETVLTHFRNVQGIGNLSSKVKIETFDKLWKNRTEYLDATIEYLKSFGADKYVVFLDPDTGLVPGVLGMQHVSENEARRVWDAMPKGNVFAFYQHQTNRKGQPWIEPKRKQLAKALGVKLTAIGIAESQKLARDVVIFYIKKA